MQNFEQRECDECNGDGFYMEQYEPLPGGSCDGDDNMGASVRCKTRCRCCNGRGTVIFYCGD